MGDADNEEFGRPWATDDGFGGAMPRLERPVDPAGGAVERFAVALRKLREQAGGMTYRQLAERTGFSVSTLADAAGGRRLPTLDVALAYAVACGGDKQEWAAKWRVAAAEQPRVRVEDGFGRAPYRGLSGFRSEDADLFFGRAQLVADVVDRVREHWVTVVLGASGVGKSSLLAAGVLPALCSGSEPSVWPLVMRPGEHPLATLLCLLDPDRAPTTDDAEPAGGAEAVIADTVRSWPNGETVLLVVDQFEELYTLCAAGERARFIDDMLALAHRTDRRLRLVVSVRADFYGRCAEHANLAEALRNNTVLVGPMSVEELREAVSRPAAVVGLSVERALLATAVHEAEGRTGVLPLLSHAMLETWRQRRGAVLTLAGFEAAGGIGGAVVRTAEAAYDALAPAQQRLAAELLLRLLAVEEDTVARRRVDLAELLDVDSDAGAVISQLADARLVTVGENTVEIAHEAVFTAWPRLRAWIDGHRDAVRAHRKISEAARVWVENEHDSSALATGARLELMRAHADSASGTLRLSKLEREFLEESGAQARRAEATARRRTRRLRTVTAAAVAAAAAAGALAGMAGKARTDALDMRDIALSRQTALTAQKLRETDPALAAQLAIAGYRKARTTEARSALLESLAKPLPARYLGGAGPTALAASTTGGPVAVSDATDGTVRLFTQASDTLTRAGVITPADPGAMVYALALSPDDRTLAVGDTEATINLWDVSDPHAPTRLAVPLRGPGGPIERIAIDPSGTELAAAGGNGVARWAIDDPTRPRQLPGLPAQTPKTVIYDPFGSRLAFGTEAGTVQLWDIHGTPTRLATLSSGDRPVPAVSFSPDGHTLVTGSHDRTIRSWDISSPSAPRLKQQLDGLFDLRVTTTAFSPDGGYLIAGSSDSRIHVLETSTWTVVQTLPHPDVVTWVAFTANGTAILSVATDGALRRWSLPSTVTHRGSAPIVDTSFTADGTRLAIFAEGSAAIWNTSDPTEPTPVIRSLTDAGSGAVLSGAGDISGDGRLLAVGTTGGDLDLVDLTDSAHPRRIAALGGSPEEVVAVAFSPDGTTLAAAGRDTAVRVWDLTEPSRPRLASVFNTPRDVVLDLDWRPSGGRLAVASADSHVYLLDLTDPTSPRQEARLDGLHSYAFSAAFSPDGDLLAVGGVDSIAILWDTRDPARPRRVGPPIAGPTGRILKLSFHPNNDLLAASVIDGTVSLWNITDTNHPTSIAVLASTGSPLNTATFRPTGDLLVAGGGDQILHTWHTDDNAVTTRICATIGDPITEQEWHTHLPDLPYNPPCLRDLLQLST
jgi:WD40 repeat protein/transcriptional regulator with XRE-family HTH domain